MAVEPFGVEPPSNNKLVVKLTGGDVAPFISSVSVQAHVIHCRAETI